MKAGLLFVLACGWLMAASADEFVVHGRIEEAGRLLPKDARMAKAVAFLQRDDLAQLPDGRQEIDGDDVYAVVSSPILRPVADVRLEAHRKYIDIQVPLNGRESFGVHVMSGDELKLPFDTQKDVVLFDGKKDVLTVAPGEFIAFFPPKGAHAPSCLPDGESAKGYRKIVVKVKSEGTEEGDIGKFDSAMAQERVAAADGIDWIDGRDLPIEGKAFADTSWYYDRLPSNVTDAVNAGVRNMKHHTSGLQFRFTTDSRKLRFRWRVYDPKQLEMQHMPRTGVSGIDVYRQAADGRWLFVRSGCPAMYTAKDGDTFEFEIAWTSGTPCLVNLPLYNGIREFSLGLERGKTVKSLPPRKNGVTKPVVFYGTSITHGGCCSRPGMAFPSIIGRQLDVPIVNLGFSGSGAMELEMADHLARIEASCYVLDCLWNMGFGNRPYKEGRQVDRVYEPFIRRLREKRPDVPIVMAEQCDVFCKGPNEKDVFIRALYGRLVAEGWKNLVYLPKDGMYSGSVEETVDGTHASDLGMVSLAKSFGAAVSKALGMKTDVGEVR